MGVIGSIGAVLGAATHVATAVVSNTWALTLGGGVAPRHHMPSVVVADGPHRTLRRYGPVAGPAVLLVPPLAAPASCYDLQPGQSLIGHLRSIGRTVYCLDYGDMGRADRDLGFEYWIDDVVPEAIGRVADDHAGHTRLGDRGEVDLVAWSLGGVISLLTTAAHPELPIRSIATFGAPNDYSKAPTAWVTRAVGLVGGDPLLGLLSRVAGGVPAPLVRIGYRATSPDRELERPLFVLRNITDADRLRRMEAIDRFQSEMPGYPGKFFRELVMRLTLANDLASGQVRFEDRVVDLGKVVVPVLAIAGETDVLAPVACVAALREVLTGSPNVEVHTVPGGHLGILAGAAAPTTSWPLLTRFLDEPEGARAAVG